MQWQSFLWVGIGGFLGANARYILSLVISQRFPTIAGRPIPSGTAFVNITGSFLLAMFLFYAAKKANFPDSAKLLIGTGFFGAYTTFSTYANESITLFQGKDWMSALAYIIGTNVLCLIGVIAGLFIANRIF
mgnify:CR=1 FL=1